MLIEMCISMFRGTLLFIIYVRFILYTLHGNDMGQFYDSANSYHMRRKYDSANSYHKKPKATKIGIHIARFSSFIESIGFQTAWNFMIAAPMIASVSDSS